MAAEDTRELIVAPADTPGGADGAARLDRVLARAWPDLSRSQLQRLIREGLVTVDGAVPSKSGHHVEPGQRVTVRIPAPPAAIPSPEAIALEILHADAHVVVVNKPAGMVVHPAAGHGGGTLVNALLHHVGALSGAGGQARPGIVHRLDKGTSGVMVVARTDAAHRALAAQFHDREVVKEYVALVWGALKAGRTMTAAIGRDPRHRTKMSSRGRHTRAAETTVIASEPLRGVSLVTVQIGTGRTHQIRVHLSEAGHAVVGDETYGGVRAHPPTHLRIVKSLDRPFLHARALTFTHPHTGRRLTFEAPLPPDLTQVLEHLKGPSA